MFRVMCIKIPVIFRTESDSFFRQELWEYSVNNNIWMFNSPLNSVKLHLLESQMLELILQNKIFCWNI